MTNDENAIARHLRVTLDDIRSLADRGFEGRPRVLGVLGTAAAMRNHPRHCHDGACRERKPRNVFRMTNSTGMVTVLCEMVGSRLRARTIDMTASVRSGTDCRNVVSWWAPQEACGTS